MIDEKIKEHIPRYGVSGYKRREADFYATPEWVTKILFNEIWNNVTVWEPAAGNLDISNVLKSWGIAVISTDIRHDPSADFLEAKTMSPLIDWIITNPPYSLAYEFVDHALALTSVKGGKVAMLLNNNWDTAKSNSLFTSMPCFMKKIVITKRIRWIKGSTGSPRENHAWYIWDHSYTGSATIEYWREDKNVL